MTKNSNKLSSQHEISSKCFLNCAEWKLSAKMTKTDSNIVKYYFYLI